MREKLKKNWEGGKSTSEGRPSESAAGVVVYLLKSSEAFLRF